MSTDKSATILEAQWMEQEIPRIKEELNALIKLEQDLLTTPLETVSTTYMDVYRTKQQQAYRFYHRRRRVTPTRNGYRERMAEAGWLTIVFRILIAAVAAFAVYTAYNYRQLEDIQRGITWGSVLLIVDIALAFVPQISAFVWERLARKAAERAAQEARQSEAFLKEKQERQIRLKQCQSRIAELQERLRFARVRYDGLRKALTKSNHMGMPTQSA